jgi:Serine hydrolase (FSH1)
LAVSLPGYGVKEVPPGLDPKITLDVVLDAVSLIKNLPWIDSKRLRLYLYGYSRGAFFAALLANRLEGLEGIVLHSGAYDLFYQETPWVRPMLNLSGQQNPKLISILPEIPTRHAPTLVLHGEKDLLVSVQQANLLRDSLEAARTSFFIPIRGIACRRRTSEKNPPFFLRKIRIGLPCYGQFPQIRVSKPANRYPARTILRSAIRLAPTTYPTGSTGATATIVQKNNLDNPQ